MNIGHRILLPAILSFLMIFSGIWVGLSGRPYNAVIFTVHKLTALAAVVFTAILIIQSLKTIGIKIVPFTLLVIAVLSVISLFVSGALLSIGKAPYVLLRLTHIILSISSVTTVVIIIYLLTKLSINN